MGDGRQLQKEKCLIKSHIFRERDTIESNKLFIPNGIAL